MAPQLRNAIFRTVERPTMSYYHFRTRRARSRSYRPTLEGLEHRQLLSYVEAAPASQVNQISDGLQFGATVAARPGGQATMVWSDTSLDSSGAGVYGRLLDAKGQPIGNQFRVNTQYEGDQQAPAIGSDAAGNTVVIWRDSVPGSNQPELFFQRYDASGQKIGENAALPGTVGFYNPFSLQVTPGGDFSVVATDGGTIHSYGVRSFDATGSDLGGSVLSIDDPGWTVSPNGVLAPFARRIGDTILLPWSEWRDRAIPDVGTRRDARVWVRRLDLEGNALGSDILVASYDGDDADWDYRNGYLAQPSLVPLDDGGFVATWYDYSAGGVACFGRRFDASGQPQGTRITFFPTTILGNQSYAVTVAELGNDNLLAAVVSAVPFEADSSDFRVFSPDGTPLTDDIPVTAASNYYQGALAITPTDGGDFLLSWGNQLDNSNGEVFAQKFIDQTTIQFSASTAQVEESAGEATITVTRTGDDSAPASVQYATLDESATPGTDYTSVTGLLSFDAGEDSRTFTVPILDDHVSEPSETFRINLSNVTGAGMTLGDPPSEQVTILDDDQPPAASTIQFAASSASAAENAGSASLTVTRAGATGLAASIAYAVTGGTATAGADYQLAAGTLSFAPGESTKNIVVDLLDDQILEGDETVQLTLSNVTGAGASLGNPTAATLTIIDDERPATLQFSASTLSTAENAGSATITITRSGGTSQAASVQYATADVTAKAGQDYQATSGTLDFAAGASSLTFAIPILDDTLVEGNETLTINLSAAAGSGVSLGSPASATLTIIDDDTPATIQFAAPTATVSESAGTATITVTRSGGGGQTVTVHYATADGSAHAGTDYQSAAGILTFGPLDTSKTITIPVIDDTSVEATETFLVALTGPSDGANLGTTQTTTLTITDNDSSGSGPGSSSLGWDLPSYSVDENQGSIALTINRTGVATDAVSVRVATQGGDALPGVQYLPLDQTLVFAAGETSKTIVIRVLDDGVSEGDRSVYLVLRDPATGAVLGTNATVPLFIRNTDMPAPVTLTAVRTVTDPHKRVTRLVVNFSGAVDPVSATRIATYRMATAGRGGSFDAKKGVTLLKLRSAAYDAVNHAVTLTLAKALKITKVVQLRINGAAPSGLFDSFGRLIDGDRDSRPGGNAVALLAKGNKVTLSRIAPAVVPPPTAAIVDALLERAALSVTVRRLSNDELK